MQPDPIIPEGQKKFAWLRRWPTLISLFIFISVLSFGTHNYFSGSLLTAGLFSTVSYCNDNKGNSAIIEYNDIPVVNIVTKIASQSSTIKKITYADYLGELKIVMDPTALDQILVTNLKTSTSKAVPNLSKEQSVKIIELSASKFITSPFKCRYTK